MLIWRAGWRPVVLPKFLPRIWGLTMAYVERRERNKGVRTEVFTRPRMGGTGPPAPSAPQSERSRSPRRLSGTPKSLAARREP
jgi:hypothetical protein